MDFEEYDYEYYDDVPELEHHYSTKDSKDHPSSNDSK
jgi:hypothetical protein